MVTKYDVISSRWSSHFWKCMFFSGIKVKFVDKMIQTIYLCVILHVKRKKWFILTVFTRFLILGKIQDGGQDGDHVWWRHRPPAAPPSIKYTSSCWEGKKLSTEGKIVSKYCIMSKTQGGEGSINPPLYHHGGMTLRVRLRVNRIKVALPMPPFCSQIIAVSKHV